MQQLGQRSEIGSFGLAFGLGALTITLLTWLGLSAPPTPCGDGGPPPAIAFQIARSSADLFNIFGPEPSECQSGVISGLRAGGRGDLFLFIPVYVAFLVSIMMAIPKPSRLATSFLATTLSFAVAGDIAETATQLYILDHLGSATSFLSALIAGNGFKTVGLSLFMLCLAAVLWTEHAMTSYFTAIILVTFASVRTAGFVIEEVRPLAPLTALAAFVVLWAYAGVRLVGQRALKGS
jgi:hypothetical protein